jgi:pilus assembly protein Flp/PilA
MRNLIAGLSVDRCGATAIEYGLIVCLLMLVILVGITAVGTQLSTLFEGIHITLADSPAG